MSRNSMQRSVCRYYNLPWVGVLALLFWRQYCHRPHTTYRVPEAQPLRYFFQCEHFKIDFSQKITWLKFVSRHSCSVEVKNVLSYVQSIFLCMVFLDTANFTSLLEWIRPVTSHKPRDFNGTAGIVCIQSCGGQRCREWSHGRSLCLLTELA